ncbi:NAD(P)-binding protein [Pseudoteredinibacter isoporae]|uniref:Spermidine dehydrogenase n=1 Tax=Pseudoteredinibacter isoporae TaxID=570281 RepID=A0A7X0JQ24_9GAMM|nr:FAD/NAD(P)-binding protein [Pseudoteredinibacter isoporae]MBB6520213.1 spermidine dehydrogenase [Pseudoteredinibacter isoporae]NHO85785.1 NAD(P)/FAD-dependent oxidoreductase [Pseudoteredinibacter isoporae]NIB25763.1 NAD(P)/FAD-dependent oxidoreductase [Pseudoteredinibacter isoporae]
MTKIRLDDETLGMNSKITRRDFVNASLVGTGTALIATSGIPGLASRAQAQGLGADWTGPGGIGDYADSNGNTAEVVNAAHALRDGQFRSLPEDIIDTGEIYDVVSVGGGFAGLSAAYTVQKEYQGKKNVLVLDNHPIFGGEAKQNEFEINGHRLYAPQGSNGFVWPPKPAEEAGLFHRYWNEIGLPNELNWKTKATGTSKNLSFPTDHFTAMGSEASNATTGFFYKNQQTGNKGQWVLGAHENGFKDAPISDKVKADLRELYSHEPLENLDLPDNWPEWLDSMTLKDFIVKEMGLSAEVLDYISGTVSTSGGGLSPEVISAYAAVQYFAPPATRIYATAAKKAEAKGESKEGVTDSTEFTLVSFPGGNAGIARHFVKKMIPDSIPGDSMTDILNNPLNWESLDRKNQSVRIRGRSMVVYVEHAGSIDKSEYVNVVYTDTATGKAYRVKARTVLMASGGWVNKHIIRDLPTGFKDAYKEFYHAPILTANVAVNNWRFMEKLGITGAQWFDGFGWFTNLRAPMDLGNQTMPLDPNKPAVLTFYVPFLQKNMPLQSEAIVARTQLFATPYKEFERQIRTKLTELFSDYGFDAKTDIEGIITNRWGHAYIVPQPGYYYGRDGRPAPREIIRQGYGRIAFGHSELTGEQLWSNAVSEGEKAVRQLMKKF